MLKFKFHYAVFHRNFPAGKVVDTNHESRRHKPSRRVEMFATKSVTSLRQTCLCCPNGIQPVTVHGESRRQSRRRNLGQVPDKVADLSRTQIMKVDDMICVADFYDLHPRQVSDFVVNLYLRL